MCCLLWKLIKATIMPKISIKGLEDVNTTGFEDLL